MAPTQTYPLQELEIGTDAIQFVSAELLADFDIPLAIVWCQISEFENRDQRRGMRIDLDKRAFIDHVDDNEEIERVMTEAAPKIVRFISELRYRFPVI